MITGRVTDQPEMVVRVAVHGPDGGKRLITAVVDTGFDGSLTLPLRINTGLKLPWRYEMSVELGDGSVTRSDIYRGTVEWDGRERPINIDAAETDALLGMSLLKGHHLDAEIRAGGNVTIQRLPPRPRQKGRRK